MLLRRAGIEESSTIICSAEEAGTSTATIGCYYGLAGLDSYLGTEFSMSMGCSRFYCTGGRTGRTGCINSCTCWKISEVLSTRTFWGCSGSSSR